MKYLQGKNQSNDYGASGWSDAFCWPSRDDVNMLKNAAERGDWNAQLRLATIYFNGDGVPQNSRQAIQWLEKAAESGSFKAQIRLANCYFYGKGANQDFANAVKYLEKAVAYDVSEHSIHAFNVQNEKKALTDAQYRLGICYLRGYGVNTNPDDGVKWLEKAAELGHQLAQIELADCYFQGLGVKKDDACGIKLLKKAAGLLEQPYPGIHPVSDMIFFSSEGHALAQRKLGFHYLKEKNYAEAIKYLKERAREPSTTPLGKDKELGRAQAELGWCYYQAGENDLAIEAFGKASQQDDCFGQLGLAYFTHLQNKPIVESITPFDRLKAVDWMSTATCKASSDEEERVAQAREVLDNEKKIANLLYQAAVSFFMVMDDECCDADLINYAFPSEVINFLENNAESPTKVILAFYFRYKKDEGKFKEYLDQASAKQDILANYLLGQQFKHSKKFDLAKICFEQVSGEYSPFERKNFSKNQYPLYVQEFLVYSAKEEFNNIKHQDDIEEKNKELNNLVAMFAHNFLGTLQCIRSNAEHDNNPAIHLKTVKMMGGALTAFSILSADDDKLVEQLKQDNAGEMNLQQNLANNLALAISQLLGKTNKDKIVNLYLQYLHKTKQIGIETSSEELRANKDYRKMWQALQHQWEDEFTALFSEHVELPLLQKWLTDNFFPVEITGFDSHNISFREYGITDSIFLIVFMEIFVNAFKYMDVSKNEPLTLNLCEEDQCYKLVCENPSTQETGRGTHKGMDFLKTIAKKLGGQFITEVTGNSFKSTFTIPSQLLK